MFSLKIVSCSLRSVSAAVANHAGLLAGTPHHQATSGSSSSSYETRLYHSRKHISTDSVLSQAVTTRASKQSKIRDTFAHIDLPEKPKKPVTPWICFVRERKDEVLRQRGKMTAAELAVILAQEWKLVDKTKYEDEYKRNHEEYMKLVEAYQNSLTPEQLDLLDFKKTAKRDDRASKMLRKTNPPVLPRNPANLYCQERSKQDDFKEMLRYKKPAQIFSDIFKEYRELSVEQKKKYIDMREEDKARFQHEFLAWYEGVMSNENLTKAAREQANVMRDRLRALNYI